MYQKKRGQGQQKSDNTRWELSQLLSHEDFIKWKHFTRYWPFVWGIHRSPVNSPHKGQWRRALMFSLICVWINGWVNNGEAGDLRHHRAHCDVIVMIFIMTGHTGLQEFIMTKWSNRKATQMYNKTTFIAKIMITYANKYFLIYLTITKHVW